MRLGDKVVIIVGGGSGLVRAIAITCAKEGADTVIGNVDILAAGKVAAEVRDLGRQALAVKADLSSGVEVNLLVSETLAKFHRIDILVNTVAAVKPAPAEELTEDDWDMAIKFNLKEAFLCSQVVAREMIKQRRGKIINVTSIAAHRAIPGQAAFSASVASLSHLTKVLAMDWARYNINVNSVCPGPILSAMVEQVKSENPELMKGLLEAIPLRRANRPEDIAAAVLFLASSESDNMTGQEIIVDGGTCALHTGGIKMV